MQMAAHGMPSPGIEKRAHVLTWEVILTQEATSPFKTLTQLWPQIILDVLWLSQVRFSQSQTSNFSQGTFHFYLSVHWVPVILIQSPTWWGRGWAAYLLSLSRVYALIFSGIPSRFSIISFKSKNCSTANTAFVFAFLLKYPSSSQGSMNASDWQGKRHIQESGGKKGSTLNTSVLII